MPKAAVLSSETWCGQPWCIWRLESCLLANRVRWEGRCSCNNVILESRCRSWDSSALCCSLLQDAGDTTLRCTPVWSLDTC